MTIDLYKPSLPGLKAFDDGLRLINVVTIQYRTSHLRVVADARQLQLDPGEEVIVNTDRGHAIARVVSPVSRSLVEDGEVPQVLRRATDADLLQAERNERNEVEAYRFAIDRIRARKLPMKLVRTQCMHDGSKIVFFFSADGRIDFRDLVKDLAHQFRTRIEMFQIGIRDGTRMIGGIGPCGRELCCSSFLTHFEPISIRMAKDQGLTLNPRKISGMCGRLMCCLVYEQKVYRRLRKRLPRPGHEVETPEGPGVVETMDIVNQRITVVLGDERRETFDLKDLRLGGSAKVHHAVDPEPSDEKILADQEASSERTRRRGRRKTSAEEPSESS